MRSRCLLVRNAEHTSELQCQRLHALFDGNERLNVVYVPRSNFRLCGTAPRQHAVMQSHLHSWRQLAEQAHIAPLPCFARSLREHAAGICNYAAYPITTARIEAGNVAIGMIRRRVRGLLDMDYFKLKIRQTAVPSPPLGRSVTGTEMVKNKAELSVTEPVRRRHHPGRWVAIAVVLIFSAVVIKSGLTNPNFQWDIVGQYFFDPGVLTGLRITIVVSIISMTLGAVLGVVLAVLRLSPNPLLGGLSRFYTWLFRGIPLLVQLLFWFNIAALYPSVNIGIPFGPTFVSLDANALISSFLAAVIGLSLHEAAYMAEIVRGGVLSVSSGQSDAGSAIGMTKLQVMRRIILPQAIRIVIPPTGNRVITMVKNTSLVSVIALADLLYSVEIVYARTFQVIPLLIVACLWYLILISILNVGQYFLENHYGKAVDTT